MNTLRYFTICFVISFMSLSVLGQNSLVKKAANAVFSLSTFRADGSLLDTSYGVFVSSNGEAISERIQENDEEIIDYVPGMFD